MKSHDGAYCLHNQPIAAISLRAAINEVIDIESRINSSDGLNEVSQITIYERHPIVE